MTPWARYRRPRSTPPRPGVYVIYLSGVLTYIGQSLNVRTRLRAHGVRWSPCGWVTTPWGKTKDFFVKVRSSRNVGDEIAREGRLIRRLRPPANRRGL